MLCHPAPLPGCYRQAPQTQLCGTCLCFQGIGPLVMIVADVMPCHAVAQQFHIQRIGGGGVHAADNAVVPVCGDAIYIYHPVIDEPVGKLPCLVAIGLLQFGAIDTLQADDACTAICQHHGKGIAIMYMHYPAPELCHGRQGKKQENS